MGGGGGDRERGEGTGVTVNPWRQMKLHELMATLEDSSVGPSCFVFVNSECLMWLGVFFFGGG